MKHRLLLFENSINFTAPMNWIISIFQKVKKKNKKIGGIKREKKTITIQKRTKVTLSNGVRRSPKIQLMSPFVNDQFFKGSFEENSKL